MGARFLDDDARKAFKSAIESIEGQSGVEVVVALRQRSAAYLHANFAVGAAVAFAALATMLFANQSFGLVSILVDPFAVGLIAAGAVHWLPQVKRLLTRPSTRTMHVGHAAKATFVERGVHNTMDRSGLLVYISWLEKEIALVADGGLLNTWTDASLSAATLKLNAAMSSGGAAVAKELERFGPSLARAIPHREGDVNELPDDIDEGTS
ncbi:MAG TPA: hypothetical protein VGM90_36345 [Kofleriaceae bacterium]